MIFKWECNKCLPEKPCKLEIENEYDIDVHPDLEPYLCPCDEKEKAEWIDVRKLKLKEFNRYNNKLRNDVK